MSVFLWIVIWCWTIIFLSGFIVYERATAYVPINQVDFRMDLVTYYLLRNLLAEEIIRSGPLVNSGDGEETVSVRANTGRNTTRLVTMLGVVSRKPFVIYGVEQLK